MVARLLILLAVIALVWWALRPRPGRAGEDGPSGASRPDEAPPPREIVACAHCGVHVPRDEALPGAQGRCYCCEAHRRAARVD